MSGMSFRFRFVCPLLSLLFLGCGSTGRALTTTDAGMEAAVPYEAGVDAAPDAPYDAPIEAAPLRDASAPAMLLFSGDGEGFYDDTWEWSGTTWTQLQVASPGSVDPSSLGRSQHAMAGLGGKVVLFGGEANPTETDLGDTWTWDGLGWAQVNVTGPPARDGHAMATLGNDVILYGGCAPSGQFLDDTWVWNGVQWSQVALTGPNPGGRCGHAMATAGSSVVLFGGVGSDPDTWLFDGTTWTASPATGPGMRAFHAMGSLGGNAVLFGGEQDANTFLDDTWTFDGTKWTESAVSGPSVRFHHAMAPLGGVLVLFGGGGPAGAPVPWLSDTWTWDGATWTQLQVDGPVGRLVYTPRVAVSLAATSSHTRGPPAPGTTLAPRGRGGATTKCR
jgi:N-acetylneuraminic acid mutarotase